MEHVNNVDFNFIIYAGFKHELSLESSLTLAYLMGLTKDIKIKLHVEALNSLKNEGFIDNMSRPLPAGLRVFRRFKTDNTELAKKLRDMYPAGMKDKTWPWRGTVNSISDRLDAFNKMYPDITGEEIEHATKDYLDRFSDESGLSLLMYFIWKKNDSSVRSILAEWVYANREMKVKQKTNTEQL